MKTTETPLNRCPNCGEPNDRASSVDADAVPESGDASICWYCNHIGIFNADLTLREPTVEEIDELTSDDRFLRMLAANPNVRRQ
jgi:hypothetical protein